jgi:tRNA-2-methylthio-N6-dimethylallyladenosine synthase
MIVKEKKFYIRTFGCQMNEYDSGVLTDRLLSAGWKPTASLEESDLIIYNTCSVREKAEQRALAHIANSASVKRHNPRMKIAVVGCMAERMKNSIFERHPEVDFVLGPDHLYHLPEMIDNGFEGESMLVSSGMPQAMDDMIPPVGPVAERGISAFVAISRGCDNYCSYCIVPYVRGPLRNRPHGEITDEINRLAGRGVKEITLLGQNVNSYNDGHYDFPDLLRLIGEIDEISRVRFTTSHPIDAGEKLFKTMVEVPSVCEWLHLPLQSGSDRILSLMNRGYSFAQYREKTGMARELIPGLCLTTDLIAGFPSETEEEFSMTLDAVTEIGFDAAFMFRYSARPGTAAADFEDVPEDSVKIERLNRLISLQQEISLKRNRRMAGGTAEVMVDGYSKKSNDCYRGKDRGGRVVIIQTDSKIDIGEIVHVKITRSNNWTLFGEV